MPDSCHAGRKSPSSFHDPVPLRGELLDKSTRERALAVPTLPDVHRASSEFRGAVFSVFEKLETTLLGTIEPEDDSLAQFGRLVVVSKLYPPLKIVEVRRYHPLVTARASVEVRACAPFRVADRRSRAHGAS